MTRRTWMSRFTLTVALAALIGCGGCVTTETVQRPKEIIPTGPVHQVAARWENRVMVTQDVVHSGAPLKGIAGRVYLFGQDLGYPVQGDGMMIAELSDVANLDKHGKPTLMERWEIPAETLKQVLRKDMLGWGYTLFLPWDTYRPDLTKVQMQVRYVPTKGLPMFTPPSVVSLQAEG